MEPQIPVLHPSLDQQRQTVQALAAIGLQDGFDGHLMDRCFIHPDVRKAVGRSNSLEHIWQRVLRPVLSRLRNREVADHEAIRLICQEAGQTPDFQQTSPDGTGKKKPGAPRLYLVH